METSGTDSGFASGVAARVRMQGRLPAGVIAGFVVGALVMAMVVPRHGGDSGSTTAAAGLSGAPSAGAATLGGSAAGTPAAGSAGTAGATSGASSSAVPGVAESSGSAVPAGTASAAGSSSAASASGPGATGPAAATSSSGNTAAGGQTTASAPSGGNGGATAAGVTGIGVNVGIIGGDSTALQPACPRCGQGGAATDHALVTGLLKAWHKSGKLPVYGRDITPLFQEANDVDAASGTSACEALVGQHPFVALTGAGAEAAGNCLTQQNHVLLVDAEGGITAAQINQDAPYWYESGPSVENILKSFADWANEEGLLRGQVLGLYSPADANGSTVQEVISATFRAEIKRLGYHIAVDYQYANQGASDDAIAVQRMRNAGVTVMFVYGSLTEPSGFQNQAEQLRYRPKYPIADLGYSFTDALADVQYNSTSEDGNVLLGTRWWTWSKKSPATPADNEAAAECLQAYEDGSGTTLDVYNDDAKIRYLLDECTDLEVIRQAMVNAGPDLTQASFVNGLYKIHSMKTAEYWSVSFAQGRIGASDDWQSAMFHKNRCCNPAGDYITMTGAYRPWF